MSMAIMVVVFKAIIEDCSTRILIGPGVIKSILLLFNVNKTFTKIVLVRVFLTICLSMGVFYVSALLFMRVLVSVAMAIRSILMS